MKKTAVLVFAFTIALAAPAQSQMADREDERYKAALVLEPTTNTVIFEKNADEALPAASMTKMMTLLVVLDAIRNGTISWDTPVTVSANAARMGGSQVYLKQGEVFPVRRMVDATMVHSANDAAMALAERVGGTERGFVTLMNQKKEQLGLQCSEFYSPHGLPGEAGQPDDVMCPRDLAQVGQILMRDPYMQKIAALETMPFRDGQFTMYNPNHLIRNYPGAYGIKTGYHGKAGFNVTAAARRGDMDLVAVVMGSPNKRANFGAAADLLSEGFAQYRVIHPVRKGMTIGHPIPVVKGAERQVPVVAGGSASILVRHGERDQVQTIIGWSPVTAPVEKGQEVGFIEVRKGGKAVTRVPVLAAAEVGREAWWRRWWPF